MATNKIVRDERSGADVVYGAEMCYKKALDLLAEMELPNGLLPLKDLDESGYIRETGFVWLKQKKPVEYYNKKLKRIVVYGTEITAYVEKHKMKKMTGVRCKELFMWINLTEMSIADASSQKIYFKSSFGVGKSFPIKAFELEDDKE